jgi:membrane protein YdbS with pleckstrin-like domain
MSDSRETTRHAAADGVFRPLDPRSIQSSTIEDAAGWLLALLVLLAALIITWSLGGVSGWPLIASVAVLAVLALGCIWATVVLSRLSYRNTRYAVTDQRIDIQRGILWKALICVPRSRIQHVKIGQGPLERRFGLASLTIHTAGTANASVGLSGLAYETAAQLRDLLMQGRPSHVN